MAVHAAALQEKRKVKKEAERVKKEAEDDEKRRLEDVRRLEIERKQREALERRKCDLASSLPPIRQHRSLFVGTS